MAATTALALGSLALGAAGTYTQYRGQREQAKTTIRVGEYNARIRENQAIAEDALARENISRTRANNRSAIGRLRARLGGSGVTASGSPLEAIADASSKMELQARDAARAAEVARQQGFAEAQATRYGAGEQAAGLKLGAAGTLMSGAARLAQQGYAYFG